MDDATGRLLVVDDDENNRDMLSRRLERRGFSVDVASDGRQALDAIARQSYDVVLLDIEMPVLSGFDVLKELRLTHPATTLPVIIATAHGEREEVIEALNLGANDFVTKPLDFPVVLARVKTQLSSKLSVDRIVALETDLRRRNTELQEANDRMRRSLDLARNMQQSLLPSLPMDISRVKFAWVYEPCDELGGDILNIFPLGNGHVGLYLLDVSGHGVPAALLSVTLSRMLSPVPGQASLVERPGPLGVEPVPPDEVVMELNRRFQMSSENLQYFTLFYGVLDVFKKQLTYVSAGQPPALYVPADGPARYLDCAGLAVGWVPEAQWDQTIVDLKDTDRIYLYSDGVTETMDGVSDQFGPDRLAEAFHAGRSLVLQQSLSDLLKLVADFRGPCPVRDDISGLAMEISVA